MALGLERLAIAIPYFFYDAGSIVMEISYVDYLVDSGTFIDTKYQEILRVAMANQANPDWKWLSEAGTEVTYSLQSGDNSCSITGRPLLAAQLTLEVNANAKIDRWYGSSSFGIYGVAFWGTSDGPAGPAIFINNPAQLLHPPDNFYNKLFITLKPGVRGSVEITPIAPYPYILVATYPTDEDPYWSPYSFPVGLGMQAGMAYPVAYPPPL